MRALGKFPPPKNAKFSGRRSALAAWLTDVRKRELAGLVARVIVNRLWQHHFGTGPCCHLERLWQNGSAAVTSRVARLAGGRV
jgi:hypothetical protein